MPLTTNQTPERHTAEDSSIRQRLNRLLQMDEVQADHTQPDITNGLTMIPKVIVRPNPFYTSITLDVTASAGKHVIVRMFNEDDKIVKMFSWFLVKGINITNIGETEMLPIGNYSLDFIDLEGEILYSTQLTKGK
jgi:hypothetical protein